MMGLQNPASIAALRSRVARLETGYATRPERPVLRFGLPAIDGFVPGGGLLTAALHAFSGAGGDTEYGAAPAQLIAALSAQCTGTVICVVNHDPRFAPGLAACGFGPDRVIYAAAGQDVLGVMEDCFRHPGLAVVVGELSGRLDLTASRRLQLAAFRLELQGARGGQPRVWLVEAPDYEGQLALIADVASATGFDAGRHRRQAA